MNNHFSADDILRLVESGDSISKIRQLILSLAVRGKLVPQEPQEEPASELLKRITAERAKLIKMGEVRKQKPLPPTKFDETPYAVPIGWEWVRMGNYAVTIMGQSPPSSTYNESGDGLPFFQGKADFGKTYPTPRKWCDNPLRVAKPNDVLISVRAPVGPTNICSELCCIGRGLAAIRLLDGAEHFYLLYTIRAFERMVADLGVGTTFSAIGKDQLHNLRIPVPPESEQRRIVAKIDELMNFCDELGEKLQEKSTVRVKVNKAALHSLVQSGNAKELAENWGRIRDNFNILYDHPDTVDELKQAILQLAVRGKLVSQDPNDEPASELLKRIAAEKAKLIKLGKIKKPKPLPPIKADEIPYELPQGWEWVRLGDLGEVTTGTTPPTSHSEYFGGITAFIKPGDIHEFSVDYRNESISDLGLEHARCIAPKSVLMVCIGGSIGKTQVVDRRVCINQQINALTPFEGLSLAFLLTALRSSILQTQVNSNAGQGTLPILNKSKWSRLICPLPPQQEQVKIENTVSGLFAQCTKVETTLRQLEISGSRLLSTQLHHLLTV